MLNATRIEKNIPETLPIGDFDWDFLEKNNDKNTHYECDVETNIKQIGILTDGTMVAKFHPSFDADEWGFKKQHGPWYFANEYELSDVIEEIRHKNYPPSIHGERKWTEKMLSNDSKLYRSLLRCVGTDLKNVETPIAEHLTPGNRRIDSVIINTEYDENDEKNNPEIWSVEAMDATGKCDETHFEKGTLGYPLAIREMYGHVTGAIVIAAEFTEEQIRDANDRNNLSWVIALVTAEEIDGKTIFTLVN